MKLRILGDSVRLRLGQSEVECIARGEVVEVSTHLGTSASAILRYALCPDATHTSLGASFEEGALRVWVPLAMAQRWATSTDVSLEGTQTSGEHALHILVEKDFQCLVPRGEQDSDGFPNPKAC